MPVNVCLPSEAAKACLAQRRRADAREAIASCHRRESSARSTPNAPRKVGRSHSDRSTTRGGGHALSPCSGSANSQPHVRARCEPLGDVGVSRRAAFFGTGDDVRVRHRVVLPQRSKTTLAARRGQRRFCHQPMDRTCQKAPQVRSRGRTSRGGREATRKRAGKPLAVTSSASSCPSSSAAACVSDNAAVHDGPGSFAIRAASRQTENTGLTRPRTQGSGRARGQDGHSRRRPQPGRLGRARPSTDSALRA